jgi:hypothetical protein
MRVIGLREGHDDSEREKRDAMSDVRPLQFSIVLRENLP